MRKIPFRVAFVGKNLPEMEDLVVRLSPHFHPLALRDWEELRERVEGFAPELVVVGPGIPGKPSYPLSVPVQTLTRADLRRTPHEIEARILQTQGSLIRPSPESQLVGRSPAIARVRGHLVAVARCSHPLLLTGENGTGKDLAATVVHQLSARAAQPFVAVNCGAIPPGLAETEFFGSVRGAFTGAENRDGYCQQARGGTLFLDEIGELPLETQATLLRVLESKELRRVGSGKTEPTDFRLICATNRTLTDEIRAGKFREDLYYRINVLTAKLPALRNRLEDLPILASHFLNSEAFELAKPVRVSPGALAKMAAYNWPGNLRQLRNVLLRAAVLHEKAELEPHHIELES